MSTLDGAATAVATSLQVPLGAWTDLEPGSAVIFYAATAGALVDLAADLGWLLNLRADVVLDGHLPARAARGDIRPGASCPSSSRLWAC